MCVVKRAIVRATVAAGASAVTSARRGVASAFLSLPSLGHGEDEVRSGRRGDYGAPLWISFLALVVSPCELLKVCHSQGPTTLLPRGNVPPPSCVTQRSVESVSKIRGRAYIPARGLAEFRGRLVSTTQPPTSTLSPLSQDQVTLSTIGRRKKLFSFFSWKLTPKKVTIVL